MPSYAALVGAAVKAVATVGACAGVGAYAHRKELLHTQAQKALDKLIAGIFLPCLILGKVTPNMNLREMLVIWPLLVMCVAMVVFGLLAGAVASRCMAAKYPAAFPRYEGLVMVALAFPNAFSVPMTLLLAIGDDPVLVRAGGPSGEALHSQIQMLFLMSYAVWVLARWSIGYPILLGAISFQGWLSKVLNPPVIACLVASACGIVRSTLLGASWPTGEEAAWLTPVWVAVDYCGRCTVPCILLALGARLDQAVTEVRATWMTKAANGNGPAGLEAQLLSTEKAAGDAPESDAVLPAIAYPVLLLLRQGAGSIFGALVACGFLRGVCGVSDPVVLMVAMLQAAGPPMINLSVMAGLSGSAEMETSKLLLFTYGASVFTWIGSIAFFLWLLA